MILVIGVLIIIKFILIGTLLFTQFRGIYVTAKSIRDLKKDNFNIIKMAKNETKHRRRYRRIFKVGVYLLITIAITTVLKIFTNGSTVSVFSTILWPLLTITYYWDYKWKNAEFEKTWKKFIKGYLKQYKIELIYDFNYIKGKIGYMWESIPPISNLFNH